jgi:hypothetical protein
MPKRPITGGDIKRVLQPSNLEVSNLRGGREFPIRYARVTRVDPKRMVVDLEYLSGVRIEAKNVPLSFPGAGSRHFFGAMPEVGDLCLVGQSPAESGRSKRPVILGWYVPSTQAGYDWLNVRSHSPDELSLTPKQKESLEGLASERRHKLRQMEKGNIIASSSQGGDLLLNESVTLANRRGNEVILRDQDQALVVRTLQQFHAGAGFRTYSGMVQRDANLLPTQISYGDSDWTSSRQVDGSKVPLGPLGLDQVEGSGEIVSPVFNDADFQVPVDFDPREILKRGLFMDVNGNLLLDNDYATYGGKPMYRVAADLKHNGVDTNVPTFAEYRIEVAHTTDGTLPVTEQTDGLDVDRLLMVPPGSNPGESGGNESGTTDPTTLSPNAPMVEFVLGTAVGNDSYGKPDEYGVPLVARVTTESGTPQTSIRAYDPAQDTLEDQIAFLLRSRDPRDVSRESFMALTKGGAWLTSFQGQGSKVAQESLRTGKVSFYGTDLDGNSRILNADGGIKIDSLEGRSQDNVGVEITAHQGAVKIFAGGSTSTGAANDDPNPKSPLNSRVGLSLVSATGTEISATEGITVAASEVAISETRRTSITASSSIDLNAGDTVSVSTKRLSMTVNGSAEYVFGGPLNGVASNGPTRSIAFSGSPLTGAIGGAVDKYEVTFGGRNEVFRLGRHMTSISVGGFVVRTMNPLTRAFGVGTGVNISTGAPLLQNGFSSSIASATLSSSVGTTTVSAKKGLVSVSGTASVLMTSLARVKIQAPLVSVLAPGSPFGGVLTDGCLDSLTGRPFLLSGTLGAATFRVGV